MGSIQLKLKPSHVPSERVCLDAEKVIVRIVLFISSTCSLHLWLLGDGFETVVENETSPEDPGNSYTQAEAKSNVWAR